jgi:hypothetical protein
LADFQNDRSANRSILGYVLEKGMASGKDLLVACNPVAGQIKTVIVDPRFGHDLCRCNDEEN